MPTFGRTSMRRLATCDVRLQRVCQAVIPYFDFSVLCGHRDEHTQNALFRLGRSMVRWPHSKHNQHPALAVDVAPYPLDWHDLDAFKELAGRLKQAANMDGLTLIWGGDWQRLVDMPHIELKEGA